MTPLGDLSPAQALVLLQGGAIKGARVLRVALLGLIGRRAVQVSHVARAPAWVREPDTELNCSSTFTGTLCGDERSLLTMIGRLPADNRSLPAFLSSARLAYGARFRGFRDDVVVPELIRSKLVDWHEERLLGIIPRMRVVQTQVGRSKAAQIELSLESLRQVPELIKTDRPKAVALVLAAGGAVLLVKELESHFAALKEAMDEAGMITASSDLNLDDWSFDSGLVDVSSGFDAADGSGADGGGDGGGGD